MTKSVPAPVRAEPICDGDHGCVHQLSVKCICSRCLSEGTTTERFYSCASHLEQAGVKHRRIRGRDANWHSLFLEMKEAT